MRDIKAFIAAERKTIATIASPSTTALSEALLDRLEAFLAAPAVEEGRFVGYLSLGRTTVHVVDTHNPSRTLCGRWIDRDYLSRNTASLDDADCKPCSTYFARLAKL